MTWLAKLLWPTLKPFVATWLVSRALCLPAAQRTILCAQAGITDAQLTAVQTCLDAYALDQLDKFRP